MKTVLITGGSGYLGSHLCKLLRLQKWRVVIFDLKAPEHKYYNEYFHGDIRDRGDVNNAFYVYEFDLVIHCASRIEVGESMKNPTEFWETNVGGTAILLSAMKKAGVKEILFSSTAAVYKASKEPIKEKNALAKNSVYGDTKAVCEQMIVDSGLKYGIFRYFNLAGADFAGEMGENHNPETHLIPKVLSNTKNVRVFGNDYDTIDGTCVRDYVHVLDVAQAHLQGWQYLQSNKSFVVNLGSGVGLSILEVLQAISDVTKEDVQIKFLPRREGDPASLVADIGKAKELLGYEPKFNITDIIWSAHLWHNLTKTK